MEGFEILPYVSSPKLSQVSNQTSLKFNWIRLACSKIGKYKISQPQNHRWKQSKQDKRDLWWRRKQWVGSGCAKQWQGLPTAFQSYTHTLLLRRPPPTSWRGTSHQAPTAQHSHHTQKGTHHRAGNLLLSSPFTVSGESQSRHYNRPLVKLFHTSSNYIMVQRKTKILSYFRKYIIWDGHRLTNMSGIKSDTTN